jgi:hypothetical protein
MPEWDSSTIVDVTIAAAVLPPLIALINRSYWPVQLRGIVALVVCMLYALVAEWIRGTLSVGSWRDAVLVVCVSAFGFYRLWWGSAGVAPWLERVTTPGGATRPVA